MTRRIALFASDLDGTFLDAQSEVSPLNARAVRIAAEQGVRTVFATGRPVRWLDPLEALADADPIVIASNGAVVWDPHARQALHSQPIDPATALEVAADVRSLVPDVMFATEYGLDWGVEDGYVPAPRHARLHPPRQGHLEDLVQRPFVKLMVVSDSLPSDALAEVTAATIAERLTVTWSMTGERGMLEVSAPGVTKGVALTRVCADLGIGLDDVAAFGDMPNDLDLLRTVGLPFAMADAHPLLLAEGFPSAGAHTDSGVGRTMLTLLGAPEPTPT